MPRDLVVGNGTLLVNIDRNLSIRDFYYPHVGLFNHVNGHINRIGVWADGQFAWLGNTWTIHVGYRHNTLITDACASNGRLGVALRFHDTVHPELNLFLRRVSVENLHTTEREIRLFFHHDFRIHETDVGDTAFFHPLTGSMVHFKRDCHILMNGRSAEGGIFEYATGIKEFGGAEGTWRDAEDGSLSMNPIEQGSVDSTISFRTKVPGGKSALVDFWIAVGRSMSEVEGLNKVAAAAPLDGLFMHCERHWTSWLQRGIGLEETSPGVLGGLEHLYYRSLLTLHTQIDRSGGIVAANDTDIMQTARAHYSYVWPRDGALVARALDLAGYPEPSRRFFHFAGGIISSEMPFFLQKYSPDGTVGASWHPWLANGKPEIPHQQDGTALVLWAAGKQYERWKDKNFSNIIFEDLVRPAADHMIKELDDTTSLPKPSYDLWEQRRGVHLFTCAAVYGALCAATKMARMFDPDRIKPYRDARDRVKPALLEYFYEPRLGRFVRSLIPDEEDRIVRPDGSVECDLTLDASMSAIFLFEVVPPRDERVMATMEAIYDRLWVRTPVGGIARYEDDYYFKVSEDVKNVPGNPWFVSTLWMAEWYIEIANSLRDLEPALDLLRWTASHASEAGLLSEQVDPITGGPLSVMPLTWSHAAFVSTVLRYQAKVHKLSTRKADKA